jgi:hypothetical protein
MLPANSTLIVRRIGVQTWSLTEPSDIQYVGIPAIQDAASTKCRSRTAYVCGSAASEHARAIRLT